MKLLIVEDEPDLLEEVKNFLEKENYICETAANFNDADEKLAVYHYDVALVDITLPGGSGLQPEEGKAAVNRKTLTLTKKEFEMLLFFVSNKNRLRNRIYTY